MKNPEWSKRLFNSLRASYESGFQHYLLSLITIQGSVFVTQLIVAKLLGPNQFGVVRAVESVISILIIFASVGMPTLAVKLPQELTSIDDRSRVLLRLLLITGIASFVVAVFCAFWSYVMGKEGHAPYLMMLVWMIVFPASSRVCQNYFVGIKSVKTVSSMTMGISVFSIVIMAALVRFGGLNGWVIGRYLSEMFLFTGFALVLRKSLAKHGGLSKEYSFGALIHAGVPNMMSILARVGMDNIGVVFLTFNNQPHDQLGYYGIGILFTMPVLLVAGAIANIAIPSFVEALPNLLAVRRKFFKVARTNFALTGLASCIGLVVGPAMIKLYFPGYLTAIPIMQILLLVIPFHSVLLTSNSLLLAGSKTSVILSINLFELVMVFALFGILVPKFGVTGAAIATLMTDILASLIFVYVALKITAKS